MLYSVILACTIEGGIGLNNNIPWSIPDDLKLFKTITTYTNCYLKKNAVIMGRKTWESLSCKPLKDRINIIVTSTPNIIKTSSNVLAFSNFDNALEYCEESMYIDKVFIIGGKSLYDLCLKNEKYSKRIDYINLSIIKEKKKCDSYIDLKEILRKYKSYNIHDVIFNSNFIYVKLINVNSNYLISS
jgi:dihydrofolate reductase/thymidylate synthase